PDIRASRSSLVFMFIVWRYSERIQIAETADRIRARARCGEPFFRLQRILHLLAKARCIAGFKEPDLRRARPDIARYNGNTQTNSFTNGNGIAVAKRRSDEYVRS